MVSHILSDSGPDRIFGALGRMGSLEAEGIAEGIKDVEINVSIGHAIVLAGGDCNGVVAEDLDPAFLVVAADSGLRWAKALGLQVHLVVGDLDSVDPQLLAETQAAGVEIMRFAMEKNFTDFELAMKEVVRRGAKRVTVVGHTGGRFDHTLGILAVISNPEFEALHIACLTSSERIIVIRRWGELPGKMGDIVSLVPIGDNATGITTTGLRYPLHDETLNVFTSRGISNEITADTACVSVKEGVLLAIIQSSVQSSVHQASGG